MVYSDEALEELNNYFKSKTAYIGTDGKFLSNLQTDTVSYILHNLTSE